MRAVSPAIAVQSGRSNVFVWVGIIAALLGVVVLFLFNPSQHGFFPRCFFKMATGLDCPGCGGLRATHQLLHGHLRAAFAFNPLFIVALPFAVFFGTRAAVEQWTGHKGPRLIPATTAVWICAGIVIAFGVLRNLPWRAWFGA